MGDRFAIGTSVVLLGLTAGCTSQPVIVP